VITNTNWLNRTENKSNGRPPWEFIIIHETQSPNPDCPSCTLNYNLSRSVGSSYTDLIGRDGIRYAYLDPEKYYSWHAGNYTQVVVDGVTYTQGELNANALGIEIDGRCDGTPATKVQLTCLGELLNFYSSKYDIALDSEHLIMHSDACSLNPSYRSDARCTTISEILSYANNSTSSPSYERTYKVLYDNSIVRQGPSRDFPEVTRFNTGATFLVDSGKYGEAVSGNDIWQHLADGRGFISDTVLARV
jgi:hypothetical protein